MEGMILIDEQTKQRFKASPTAGASWYLTPLSKPEQPPESMVVEKLGAARKEMSEMRGKLSRMKTLSLSFQTDLKRLKSALRIRKTYEECPDCGHLLEAGTEHSTRCRHYHDESMLNF